jgi:acylpyruvate hydrolase
VNRVCLGVVIGRDGSDIPKENVMSGGYVAGYALALDMTARDFQNEAKKKGHPWSLAKGFDTSCPVSDILTQVLCFSIFGVAVISQLSTVYRG